MPDFLALKRDVGLMLSNADEHSGPQGPRTFYAVDFSEIYAYTYPDATKNEVRLFSQETDVDPTQQFGINEHLLENIFFSPQDAPICARWRARISPTRISRSAPRPGTASGTSPDSTARPVGGQSTDAGEGHSKDSPVTVLTRTVASSTHRS